MPKALTAQPDVMRGLVRLAAQGAPAGSAVVTRRTNRLVETIRGGLFTVSTGGAIVTDAEPHFGTELTYRMVDSPTNRYIQSNRVLNPRFAVDLSNWAFSADRTVARETDPALAPARDAVTSARIGPRTGGQGNGGRLERLLARFSPSGLTAGRWYVSGQLRYDSPDIWLWSDAKAAGNWQTVKNKGTWQDVKAAQSPLAGQPFASLWAAVLAPTTTPQESRRNLVLNPQAIGATGWVSRSQGGTVTRTAQTGQSGWPTGVTTSCRVTWNAAATAIGGGLGVGGAPGSSPVTVVAGTQIIGSLYARPSKAQVMAAGFVFYNAAGAVVTGGTYGTSTPCPAGGVTRLVVANTVPDGAVAAQLIIDTRTGSTIWAVNDYVEATNAQVEVGDQLLPYFDGSSGTTGATTHAWTGTAGASASVEAVTDYTQLVAPIQVLGVQASDNGGWATFQAVIEIPAGAPANCQIALYQGPVLREYTVTWWLSTLMVCPEAEYLGGGAVLPYFDGDTPITSIGDPGARLAPGYDWMALTGDAAITWQGTPNASWSQLIGPSQIFAEVTTSIGAPNADLLPKVKIPIFLSDPVAPQLSQWFELLEIGDLTYAARQQLFDVIGRGAAIAVNQKRGWATGELRLMTYTLEDAEICERLFESGRILYLRNPDPRYPENGWWVAIGDVASGRPGATVAWAPERLWSVPFVRVERPEGLINATSSVTWSITKNNYTWQQLRDAKKDWLDAALTGPSA